MHWQFICKYSPGMWVKALLRVGNVTASCGGGKWCLFSKYVNLERFPWWEMQNPPFCSRGWGTGYQTAHQKPGSKHLYRFRERWIYARKRNSLVKAPFFVPFIANVFSNRFVLTSKRISVKYNYRGRLQLRRYQSCVCRNRASEHLQMEGVCRVSLHVISCFFMNLPAVVHAVCLKTRILQQFSF